MSKERKFNGKSNAGSKDTGKVGTSDKYTGTFTFVEGYLDGTDKQWLEDNSDGADGLVFDFLFALEPGYKFSLSFDGKSGRYLATLACSVVGLADCGKILVSRGATPFDATYALCYRHTVKFKDGWGEANTSKTSRWD